MATTTILDIVKVSELAVVNRLTDNDYLIVNDVQASGVVESKTIVINDLAISVAERTRLRNLLDVSNVNPALNQVLRWNGTVWEGSDESDNGIGLTDLSAFTDTTPSGGGKLEYDNNLGLFTFYPADVFGPISNHENVSAQKPENGDVLTWSEVDSNWYPADAIDLKVVQRPPNGGGTLVLDGDTLIYTPPYLGDFITEDLVETDPIFMASPAADISYNDISRWDTAHSWGDHALAGYLKQVRLNDLVDVNVINAKNDNILKYNEATHSWFPGTSVVKRLADIEDVVVGGAKTGDIIKWNNQAKVWASEPNRLNTLADVNTNKLSNDAFLTWNGTEWVADNLYFIREVEAGDGLSGGGVANFVNKGYVRVDINAGAGLRFSGDSLVVYPGDAISTAGDKVNVIPGNAIDVSGNKVNVRPGTAIDVSADKVNVRTGDGIGVNSANQLEVKAHSGLGRNEDGVFVNPGVAIDITGDKVNVRQGNGITVDNDNRLEVQAGGGLGGSDSGIFVNPGVAINTTGDKVNVIPGTAINTTGNKVNVTPGTAIDTSGNKVNVTVGTAINTTGDRLNVVAGNAIDTTGNKVNVTPGTAIDITGDKVNVRQGNGITINSANQLEVQAGSGLGGSDSGIFVNPGDAISTANDKVSVIPGNAIDVSGNKVNVRQGNGITINSANQLEVQAGSGLSASSGGIYVNPGRAIDLSGDAINCRTSKGIYVDSDNRLEVNPGKGIGADNSGVHVRPGRAIDCSDDKVNVRVGPGMEVNSDNRLEVGAGSGLSANSSNLYVNPGVAIDTNNDEVNVRTAGGIYVNSNNRLEIDGGPGLKQDPNGLSVKAGRAIDTSGDFINVREGPGLFLNSENRLEVGAGSGLSTNSANVFVNTGDAIDTNNDQVNVRVGTGLYIEEETNKIRVGPGDGIQAAGDYIHIADNERQTNGAPPTASPTGHTGLEIRARQIWVHVDNKTIDINSNNALYVKEAPLKGDGRVVWGVVKTDGSKVNSGSGDWEAKKYGDHGRVKISLKDRSNLREAAVLVTDYDDEGDHISGCFGKPGRDNGCDSYEAIIYSRDLQNLESRKAQALMNSIRAGETEVPSIYNDAFDGWDSNDDSTEGISFMIIFPD